MRIETKKLTEIKPADYNPRMDLKPGDVEYEKIRKSISEFGLVDPIIWNESTGNIVGGHQRYKVLKDLGYKEVQVSVVTLSGDREKALNIALNKISGEFDREKLVQLLDSLNESDIDIELTGFGYDELGDILSSGEYGDQVHEESHYTDKIKAPEYEPKEVESPEIDTLYNDDRAEYIKYDIDQANIPDDVKDFLRLAAMRHVVFNYSRIAEFYAHADAEVQDLMEQSALVIIDYNKAIKHGFVELTAIAFAEGEEAEESEGVESDEQ